MSEKDYTDDEILTPPPVEKTDKCCCRPTAWYHRDTCPEWGQTL